MAGRRWLAEEMAGVGLEPTLDAVGNLYGRQPNVTQALLLGSHTGSVPNGDWLDGELEIYGIEVSRAWRKAYPDAEMGIDVIAFSDEERRFLSCLGSLVILRQAHSPAEFDALVGNNPSLSRSITAAGAANPAVPSSRPARHLAYLEAHIEQAPNSTIPVWTLAW